MKRTSLMLALATGLFVAVACNHQQSDADAIRAGIMQHLTGVGTLNMSAMTMDIRSVTVNGDKAHADVEFRPKTGAPVGAGMQVSYNLNKENGAWVVLKALPAGGMIQHPDPGQNPHQNSNLHLGNMPNFSDILNPAGAPASGNLPAGHPAVGAQPAYSSPSANDQTSAKPR